MSARYVIEPERRVPVAGEYEVVVLGGGPAGLAAATSAARCGARTLLVERYGFLGGMGTAGGVTNFAGLYANVHGTVTQVVHGVADELLERIERLGGLNAPQGIFGDRTRVRSYDVSAFKCAADDLATSSGVELRFHSWAAGAAMDGRRIDALVIETKSGRQAIRGRVFVDCSGDGDLAAWAGAPWEKGGAAGELLYPTLMFRVGNVDAARAAETIKELGDLDRLMEQAERDGEYRFARKGAIARPQKNPSEWRVNVTQVRNSEGRAMDATDALQFSAGEIEGRRQVQEYFRFLRKRVPGFEAAGIVEIAPQVGVRETRRIVGLHQLSADDVLECRSFDDTIGANGWPLEIHLQGRVDWRWPRQPRGYNHLPYRMLVPREVDNLLVAGRCASMTHEGQASARVSGGCLAMGQAAGTAAALACAGPARPAKIAVAELQRRLERDGAWLGLADS